MIAISSVSHLVCIVDDDESVRIAMGSLIRSLGHEASVFESAEAFLVSPEVEQTSCLIVDMQMPGMSGLDLQVELKARRPRLPVIIITAFPEPRLRQQAEASGAVGFFSKPIDGDIFVECLQRALEES
jgi:FixJ family two-component response regulator